MDNEDIVIEPSAVVLDPDTGKGSVTLRNIGVYDCGYKIKTTHPLSYSVRPSTGILKKQEEVGVFFSIKYLEHETPKQISRKDLERHKFLFQFVGGTRSLIENNLHRLFTKPGIKIIEKRLSVTTTAVPVSDTVSIPDSLRSSSPEEEESCVLVLVSLCIIGYYFGLLLQRHVLGP